MPQRSPVITQHCVLFLVHCAQPDWRLYVAPQVPKNCALSILACQKILFQVHTAGGGAASNVWRTIRQRMLGVPVVRSEQAEAAYGAALLAHKARPAHDV